jgi:hypothetical protein
MLLLAAPLLFITLVGFGLRALWAARELAERVPTPGRLRRVGMPSDKLAGQRVLLSGIWSGSGLTTAWHTQAPRAPSPEVQSVTPGRATIRCAEGQRSVDVALFGPIQVILGHESGPNGLERIRPGRTALVDGVLREAPAPEGGNYRAAEKHYQLVPHKTEWEGRPLAVYSDEPARSKRRAAYVLLGLALGWVATAAVFIYGSRAH